ncbi:hypothetical protein BU26DRAFT_566406 [Trematosphaeria pertusa]|uniref:Extracellular membrane protein CFEM domain-containing protein n=1 Tax=Trematosphaeria pertusa TaxID=390896 RepID=A0A6A6IB39_9PLEO|nr:uncharacterized protein BU26DRAFT_566406 [Trematosphaeria pertusa]KAF2247427.1 hypothetical protein BU26DRAFT_566406 [Trematosphaeria pertusa]
MASRSRKAFYQQSLFAVLLSLHTAYAQVGTVTQDITTISAFPLQKDCAQSCFVRTGACPYDVLGSEIGCATVGGCRNSGWQATNDCYCRPDLQVPAQSYLTSCIEYYCSVGDYSIDASTAGGIYAQYCSEKGYTSQAAPATVEATTTGGASGGTKTAGGVGGVTGPTATSTSSSSSSSKSLSITEIIGIVVGSLAALIFLLVIGKYVLKTCAGTRPPKVQQWPHYQQPPPPPVQQQQPIYPQMPQSYYGAPTFPQRDADDIGPDDSVSMVSGMPRPAPTLLSGMQGPPPRY